MGKLHIYGSDRISTLLNDRVGMYTYPDTVYPVPAVSTADFQPVWRDYRKYELKNHLGNVTTVVNANKIARDDDANGIIDGFDAIIEGAYDYSPFGVTRKSFEPNYTAGTSGEANPLAPDFRWCFDGDGIEANGSGHDATLYNMTATADRNSETGNALESQGNANSYMEIQHDPSLVFGGNDFTVGIWVKRLALNSGWNHTIAAGKWHSGQQASQNEWYLAISNGGSGNNPPQFAIQAGSTKYTAAGTALPVGSWYHLVGVREGNNIKLYVDGTLVDTEYVGTAVVNTVASRNILLGLMGNGKYLKAGFDEFVVYHRALDATEVNELYGMGCDDCEGEDGEMASGGYRYGFNGKEKDDEVKGSGNQYDYGFRIYDTRIAKFLSVDPLTKSYPWYTPYQFAGNSPVWKIDLDGLEEAVSRANYEDLNVFQKMGVQYLVFMTQYQDFTTRTSMFDTDIRNYREEDQIFKSYQSVLFAVTLGQLSEGIPDPTDVVPALRSMRNWDETSTLIKKSDEILVYKLAEDVKPIVSDLTEEVGRGTVLIDDLVAHRNTHILNRHRSGANKPNKTEFPEDWSDDKIIDTVNRIANDPNAPGGIRPNGNNTYDTPYKTSTVDGIDITVDFFPVDHPKFSGKVSTAYPTNTPRNPPANP